MTYGFNPHDTTQAAPSLQNVILNQALSYVSKYPYYTTEFTAGLEAVANAVESAYILTPKADLPKVTGDGSGMLTVDGHKGFFVLPFGELRLAHARKLATTWAAITQHLEAEEKAKAAEESKAKVEAERAAETARTARLNEIADEWFGKDFADIGPNKAAAVKEIYRLETELNAKDAA